MHYKRKAHRGRGKQNTMDNQAMRFCGNSQSKTWHGKRYHQSKNQRNRVSAADFD